jgi:hypothetical protein
MALTLPTLDEVGKLAIQRDLAELQLRLDRPGNRSCRRQRLAEQVNLAGTGEPRTRSGADLDDLACDGHGLHRRDLERCGHGYYRSQDDGNDS